ncbi:MAG: hypothetical protein U9R25_17695 [Chloroflexota bacterium]|nr:hypothetical protein [Chloroflexota bacterium]
MSSGLNMMAWREILARVMDSFDHQDNISPDWLINPATGRRLKLDQLYDEVGLAIRFVGLTARGQPRQSDWELTDDEQRNQIRAELCRQNDVELFLLDPNTPYPRDQLRKLRSALSRISRLLAQGNRPDEDKLTYMPMLAESRARLDEVVSRVRQPEDLAIYAELWRDRETESIAATRTPVAKGNAGAVAPVDFKPGMPIIHGKFGAGTVERVDGIDDPQITIRFEDGAERRFLASLVADKLQSQ